MVYCHISCCSSSGTVEMVE